MWTDELLAGRQRLAEELGNDHPETPAFAELYRLARLGLALERIGFADFADVLDWSAVATWDTTIGMEKREILNDLLRLPAWRRE